MLLNIFGILFEGKLKLNIQESVASFRHINMVIIYAFKFIKSNKEDLSL